MRVLVLGGSVFVGRRLVDVLLDRGHEISVCNRGLTSTELPPGVKHLRGDRTDAASMRAALGGRDWDVVYDVSGFVMAAGGSDIADLLDLLEGRTGHYQFVSSIMAYDQGLAGQFPWTEDLPTNRQGPDSYGGFKAMAEGELLDRWEARRFPVSIVRPAAIYGPCNNIYDMEAAMFSRLLAHRPILVPHGGLVVASYGHVDDLCRSMVELAALPEAAGHIVNITTDALTVNRYIEVLAGVVEAEPEVVQVPDEMVGGLAKPAWGHLFGVAHHAELSTEKARQTFGLTPVFGIEEGHRDAYKWFLDQGWDRLDGPLADTTWRSTWDFVHEAAIAAAVRTVRG